MREIILDLFTLTRKVKTVDKHSKTTYRARFEDEDGNTIVLHVPPNIWERLFPGASLPWNIVKRQDVLEEKITP